MAAMLVLLNQAVIDVGDPFETLKALGVTDLHTPSMGKLVQRMGQDAAFAGKGLENARMTASAANVGQR